MVRINCVLSFDKMPIKHHVSYSQEQDHIIGFKNYGAQRSNKLASYALVFMIGNFPIL